MVTMQRFSSKLLKAIFRARVGKLDLLRWIDVNILGGVSRDADIVAAPEKLVGSLPARYVC